MNRNVVKRRRRGAAVAACAVLLLSACGNGDTEPDGPTTTTPPRPAPVGNERGQIEAREDVTSFHPDASQVGARAERVTYLSTSGVDGSGVEVVATIFIPKDAAPEGGWPIVTIGHGTTGVTDECAPSDSADLLGS
ncbi:MAG: lipase, partial [Rhodococcus sp.]|nr:lipase [Rhodococcus sp. (in: high G+C Gram-positive bacteria)]